MKIVGCILISLPLIFLFSSGCCTSLQGACDNRTTCCSNACEEGTCCAPVGYEAQEQADCCNGLVYSDIEGSCLEPESACTVAGCSWYGSSVRGGGDCDCNGVIVHYDPGTGGGLVLPRCTECEQDSTCPITNYQYVLTYTDRLDRDVVRFWASDDAHAENCVRTLMRSHGCYAYPESEDDETCQAEGGRRG